MATRVASLVEVALDDLPQEIGRPNVGGGGLAMGCLAVGIAHEMGWEFEELGALHGCAEREFIVVRAPGCTGAIAGP
jgi:hypothetical protein